MMPVVDALVSSIIVHHRLPIVGPGSDDIPSIQDAWEPRKERQADRDEELGAAAFAHDDWKRWEEEGDDAETEAALRRSQ